MSEVNMPEEESMGMDFFDGLDLRSDRDKFIERLAAEHPGIDPVAACKHVGIEVGDVERRSGQGFTGKCPETVERLASELGVGKVKAKKKGGGAAKKKVGNRAANADWSQEYLMGVKEIVKDEGIIYDSLAATFYRSRKSYFHAIDKEDIMTLIHQKFPTSERKHRSTAFDMIKGEAARSVEFDKGIPGSMKKKFQGMTYMDAMDNMYKDFIRFQDSATGGPVMFNVRRDVTCPIEDKYCSRVELPYSYDENAVPGDEWFKFLKDITLGDKQMEMLIQEMFGYCLTNETSFQKAFMLLGDHGSNGKGVLMNMLKAVVGTHNCGGVAMDQFSKSSNLTELINKKVNIDDDTEQMPGTRLVVAMFKKLTGEGEITVDPKYRNAFKFRNLAKLIFLANELPFSSSQEAYYRRFCYMRFDMRAVDNPQEPHERKKIRKLDDKLMTYLPGIFNWSMEGLRRLMGNGEFTVCESAIRTMNEHKVQNSLPLAFMAEVESKTDGLLVDPYGDVSNAVQTSVLKTGVFIERTTWYELFKRWVEEERPAVNQKPLKSAFEKAIIGHYGIRAEIKKSRMKIIPDEEI